MRLRVVLWVGLLAAGGVKADLDISQRLTARWAYGLDAGRHQLLDLYWQPEARWRFAQGGRLTALARIRTQTEAGLRPADVQRAAYAPISRPGLLADSTAAELREFHYATSAGGWYLTLGKQQIVWGKADGLKVLDVVNPQSFNEFILEDFEQSRIPLWSVNAERDIGNATLQLLWISDRTYHALPTPQGRYAFRSSRLVPVAPAGVAVDLRAPRRPGRPLRDSDAGLRLSGFSRGWDWSLNYLYQYHNQAALHQQRLPGRVPVVRVTPRYHRTHVIGGTFSRAFGDWVLRGELGYFSRRLWLSRQPGDADGLRDSPELSYVIGLDWSGLTDTFISAQLLQSRLTDPHAGITRPRVDTNTTLLLRRDFRNDTMQAELLWIANHHDGDGLLRPKLRYEWRDGLDVWAGLDVFYGDRDGLFGQFRDRDRLLLGMELAF